MENMVSAAVILAGVCAGVFVHLVKSQKSLKKVKILVESEENPKKAA